MENKDENPHDFIELLALRDQLDKMSDLVKQKEREFELKRDEYHTDLKMKQKQINNLSSELNEIKRINLSLKEDLELKKSQMRKLRLESDEEMKKRDRIMHQVMSEKLNKLIADHLQQKQLLIDEFKQAHELLKLNLNQSKQEIEQLKDEIVLSEASRQQDLDAIRQLKLELSDNQEKLNRLQDEKKKLQMELINRENTFNKTFNNLNYLKCSCGKKSKH